MMQVIHITDLFNPPGDPDDHFDLLTLLSLKDLPVAAVVLDHTVDRGVPGVRTVKKAAELFGRPAIPCAVGLSERLKSQRDTAEDRPIGQQAAIRLILEQLEHCPDHGMIFTIVGSLRDLAAAYNRDPSLFHAKVARLMVNAGDSCGQIGPKDWNTALDLFAWRRIMTSGLPIDWFPCNPSKGRGRANNHVSYWSFPQDKFLAGCPERVRAFFNAEGISSVDPVKRHMWSTVSFAEAAKRAGRAGGDVEAMASYDMEAATLEIDEEGTARWSMGDTGSGVKIRILTIRDAVAYEADMNRFLCGCFASVESTSDDVSRIEVCQ
jgi:hypothetical protein